MPRFTLRDAFGYAYHLTSSDEGVVKGWLIEHARLVMNTSQAHMPATLEVVPMYASGLRPDGTQQSDWPGHAELRSEQFAMTAERLGALADWLRDERDGGHQ